MISDITVKTFQQWLEELAPADLAASWDNVGLQIGHPEEKVRKVMVSLDPSLAVLNEAIEYNCNLVITHHPLIFKPINRISFDEPIGEVIRLAVLNDLSIVSAHTNLDAANGGVNDTLSSLLDLEDTRCLQDTGLPVEDPVLESIARVGNLSTSMEVEELVTFLKEKLSLDKVRVVAGSGSSKVERVLICGGSGGTAVRVAIQTGCDALISGDIKYHEAMLALENGLAIFDVGHFASERVILEKLAAYFRKKLELCNASIEVIEAKNERDPFTIM